VANEHNLKPVRSKREARERGRNGGIKSGATRRRKAALRDTMNKLLTMKVEVEGLSDILRSDGGESTYEEVIAMAMIQQASLGDVRAYQAIMKTVGQTDKSEADLEEQRSKVELNKARKEDITGENENDEALDRLDQILKEVRDNAIKQETK
jgi:hypothetical protein